MRIISPTTKCFHEIEQYYDLNRIIYIPRKLWKPKFEFHQENLILVGSKLEITYVQQWENPKQGTARDYSRGPLLNEMYDKQRWNGEWQKSKV